MRKCALLASAIFLLPWGSLGQQAASPTAPSAKAPSAQAGSSVQTAGAEKPSAPPELINLMDAKIHAEWEAFMKKDKTAYAALLDDEYVAVENDGEGERTKWRMLREVEHSMYTSYNLSFLKVIQLGPDAAFVRYEAFLRFPVKSGVPFEKLLIGEIWVKRGGQWKSLHYQETRVK